MTEEEKTKEQPDAPKADQALPAEESMDEGVKRQYTLSLILSPDLKYEETDQYRASLNEKIGESNGDVVSSICSEAPKQFAYAINRGTQGYFCECVFGATPEALKSIENAVKSDKQVIRYLLEVKQSIPAKRQKRARKSQPTYERVPSPAAPGESRQASRGALEDADKNREKVNMDEIEKKLDEIIGNI